MKMKMTLLTIAMLTVTGNMIAMGNTQIQTGTVISSQGGTTAANEKTLQEMLPSDAIQKEAASLVTIDKNGTVSLNVNNGAIQLPADLLELTNNMLTMAHTMRPEDDSKIEELQIAYTQIRCPEWRQELINLMGGNKPFMDALAKFDNDQRTYNAAWITLRRDTQAEGPANANPSEELKNLIPLDRSLKTQFANLLKMFMTTNKDLEAHMIKTEYLINQQQQWLIAFGMAINPALKKTISAETANNVKDALQALHTPAKVADLQKKQATVKK